MANGNDKRVEPTVLPAAAACLQRRRMKEHRPLTAFSMHSPLPHGQRDALQGRYRSVTLDTTYLSEPSCEPASIRKLSFRSPHQSATRVLWHGQMRFSIADSSSPAQRAFAPIESEAGFAGLRLPALSVSHARHHAHGAQRSALLGINRLALSAAGDQQPRTEQIARMLLVAKRIPYRFCCPIYRPELTLST